MNWILGWLDDVAVWLFMQGLQSQESHRNTLNWSANVDRAWKKLVGVPEAEDTALSFLPENSPDWLIEEASHMTTCQFLTESSARANSWLRTNQAQKNLGFKGE